MLELMLAEAVRKRRRKCIHSTKPNCYTDLKLSRKRLGLLINFNSQLLKDGFKRIVV
jgi:hypothetical protein